MPVRPICRHRIMIQVVIDAPAGKAFCAVSREFAAREAWRSHTSAMDSSRELRRSAGLVALLASNLFPLLGLLFWGWKPGDLLVLYWLENVAIGLWSVAKIVTAKNMPMVMVADDELSELNARMPQFMYAVPYFLAAFFCVHFGMFTMVHGVFTFFVANQIGMKTSIAYWFLAWLGFVASHGVSFFKNWMPSERFKTTPMQAMQQPYGRIIVLHLAVLGSGFLIALANFDSNAPAYLLLALKTALDIKLYQRSHRDDAPPPAVQSPA